MSKSSSPLVQTVLSLDEHLAELERVGAKINTMKMTSEFDFEHMRKLLVRFAECGQGVSDEVTKLSRQLNEARARAEEVATGVASRADLLKARTDKQNERFDQFTALSAKVAVLNQSISALRPPQGEALSLADRNQLLSRLQDFDSQIAPLIDEASTLRTQAREEGLRSLEQQADSLAQSLVVVRQKIQSLSPEAIH